MRETGSSRVSYISERVYRALLVSYPKEFQGEYGPQMAQAFRDLCREELGRGGAAGFIGLWVCTVLDLAVTALAQRSSDGANHEEAVMKDYKLAAIGFVLLLAPLYFVSASLLKYGLGVGFIFDPLDRTFLSDPERLHVFNLISPVVFLGGLVVALALNACAVLRLNISKEDGALVSTVRLRITFLNITVAASSFLLLGMLMGYVFLETAVGAGQ